MGLLTYLRSVITVSPDLEAALGRIVRRKNVPKGHYLVRSGERCNELYFVERGLVRGYYLNDEKEITNWMAVDGEFATSFYSFITCMPATESIEVLETSALTQISYDDLQMLYHDFPETERIGRILTETYYIRLEGRLLGMQFTSAKDRYEQLLANNALLLQKAPLGYIASYLGMTQETLSRIRKNIMPALPASPVVQDENPNS